MNLFLYGLALILLASPLSGGADTEQDGHQHPATESADHDDQTAPGDGTLTLTEAQRTMIDLRVETLVPRAGQSRQLVVPAELTNNQYRTWTVPVGIDSQVRRRSASLGQHLKAGDPIADLFSPAMADLQSELRVSADEWRRVRALGQRTVGNQRYLDVRGRYQALRARARGYGLGDADLAAIEKGDSEAGVYTVRAPDAGLVLTDAFQQGQWLMAGEALITLVDESELWAEAALPPEPGLQIPAGTVARVVVGDVSVPGTVIQAGHRLDPVTRTLQVRVRVPNGDHRLHPGMFAEVGLSLALPDNALSVPEAALTRGADGDWQVFVEDSPGRYRPQEVTPAGRVGARRLIQGIAEGTRVVTEGAFFLAGELAKGGFDVHAH
tara:strand:+ start:41874 stop:43019 length:1146 start_codon:yes stop_codon:yes gene_type:complete